MSKTFAHVVSAFFKAVFVLLVVLLINEVGFIRGEYGYFTVYIFPLLYMAAGMSAKWFKKWWILLFPLVILTLVYHIVNFGPGIYPYEHIVYLESGIFPGIVARKICKYEENLKN